MYNVPASEAELLSIYFEETASHNYRKNKEMSQSTGSKGTRANEITDIELGDLEDEEDEE